MRTNTGYGRILLILSVLTNKSGHGILRIEFSYKDIREQYEWLKGRVRVGTCTGSKWNETEWCGFSHFRQLPSNDASPHCPVGLHLTSLMACSFIPPTIPRRGYIGLFMVMVARMLGGVGSLGARSHLRRLPVALGVIRHAVYMYKGVTLERRGVRAYCTITYTQCSRYWSTSYGTSIHMY
jgi:hypothetical protein